MPDRRLEGRYALVTGGSRGIGRAIAERFAAEGATVAVNYGGNAKAAAEVVAGIKGREGDNGDEPRDHFAVGTDVSSEEAVERMMREIVARWGRLDILVNNAGIQDTTSGDAFDLGTVQKILGINLVGAAVCARAAIAHFLSRPGGGVVINNTSVHEIIPKPDYAAYAMSKAGLGHLTKTLALEFADRGIRVNAVGPGAVITDINEAWVDDPEKKAAVESHIPMGFAATPEMIAPVFAFLASDEAAYITGQTIFACGGLTLYGDFKQNWSS